MLKTNWKELCLIIIATMILVMPQIALADSQECDSGSTEPSGLIYAEVCGLYESGADYYYREYHVAEFSPVVLDPHWYIAGYDIYFNIVYSSYGYGDLRVTLGERVSFAETYAAGHLCPGEYSCSVHVFIGPPGTA